MELEHETIIVPDVHGRDFWKEALPYIQNATEVIFLGDYLDPYPHEGLSPEQALDNFKEILEKTRDCKNVYMLLGNHDMTYIAPEADICECRTDYDHFEEIQQLFLENANRFRFVWEHDSYPHVTLFSHAGLHEKWLSKLDEICSGRSLLVLQETLAKLLEAEYKDQLFALLADVGPSRWGMAEEGSCVWADIQEFRFETNPLLQYQIVGHTQQVRKEGTKVHFRWVGGEPVRINNVVCLDCHQCFYLDSEGDIRFLKDNRVVY